jgi:hypothetical protein
MVLTHAASYSYLLEVQVFKPMTNSHHQHGTNGKELDSHGEEHIEEIFGQLWAILDSPQPRVSHGSGHLAWICSDLVRERKIRPEDYHLVSHF